MNNLSRIFLVAVFLFALFSAACQEKKETAVPATKPAVAEKSSTTNSSTQGQGIDKKDQEQINKIQDMIK